MYVRVCEKKGPASAASASAFRISGCDAGIKFLKNLNRTFLCNL